MGDQPGDGWHRDGASLRSAAADRIAAALRDRPETPARARLRRTQLARRDPPADRLRSPATAPITGEAAPPLADIDAVFVLNLRHEVARWAMTAEALSRHRVQFERFPAVDGNREEVAAGWRAYSAAGFESEEERRLGRRLIESPGAWGYLKTMENLLETAKSRRLRSFAVFDDDVLLHHRFGDLVAAAWEELPVGWVLVYLGCTQTDWDAAETYSDHLYHPRGLANGSFAFVIDAAAFDLALNETRRRLAPFDIGGLRTIDRTHPDRTFALHPQAVAADVTASSIRPPRDLAGAASRAGWDPADFERRGFAFAPWSEGVHLDSEGLISVILVVEAADDPVPALTSLRAQTYGKLEIIVVANGFDGASPEILERMHQEDTRIRLLATTTPEPAPAAADAALACATGDMIAFAAPRRVSLPHHLEACVQSLDAAPSCFAVRAVTAPVDGLPPAGDGPVEWLDWARSHRIGVPRPSTGAGVIRRRVLEACGGLTTHTVAGVEEWVRRAGLTRRRETSAPLYGPDVTAVVAIEAGDGRGGADPGDWTAYHDEIAARLRPAYRGFDLPRTVVEIRP